MSHLVKSYPTSKLSLALITTTTLTAALTANVSLAAGLDRSGQDNTAFFQDGTYAETVYAYLDADVTGTDNNGTKIENIVETYDFARFGVKADVNDRVSVGILYDEPWGAAIRYNDDNTFTSQDADTSIKNLVNKKIPSVTNMASAIATEAYLRGNGKITEADALRNAMGVAQVAASTLGEGTNVEIRSNSLTALVGVKFGEKKNIQVYGGPVAQRLRGDLHLRGTSYSAATGYDHHVSPTIDMGYALGAAFYKPEIGLKAALTYRSKIKHETNIAENVPFANVFPEGSPPATAYESFYAANGKSTLKVDTPESYNLDFQTGLNPTTLATAHVRYVPWSNFKITPPAYNALTQTLLKKDLPIVDYSNDQWKVELGLAKRLNPKLAVSGNISWDSGAGNPVSSLGPIEGYYGAGLGAKYNVTDEWAVSLGGRYLWFGDAKASLASGATVGNFEDNNGYVVGLKLSYQDK